MIIYNKTKIICAIIGIVVIMISGYRLSKQDLPEQLTSTSRHQNLPVQREVIDQRKGLKREKQHFTQKIFKSDFHRWQIDKSQVGDRKMRSSWLERGRDILKRRSIILKKLIRSDPERALEIRLSDRDRRRIPDRLLGYIEKPLTGRVQLERSCALFDDHAEDQFYITVGTLQIRTYVYGQRLHHLSHVIDDADGIVMEGVAALVDGPYPQGVSNETILKQGDSYADNLGLGPKPYRVKILVVPINFPDNPDETVVSKGEITELLKSIGEWYRKISHGVILGFDIDVADKVTVPETISHYGGLGYHGYRTISSDAAAILNADPNAYQVMNTQSYQRIIYGWKRSSFSFAGMANAPGSKVWVDGSWTFETLAHELGHNFGALHADKLVTEDIAFSPGIDFARSPYGPFFDAVDGTRTLSIHEYGNPYDIMGRGRSYNGMHATTLAAFAWLNPRSVMTLTDEDMERGVRAVLHSYDGNTFPEEGNSAIILNGESGREYIIEGSDFYGLNLYWRRPGNHDVLIDFSGRRSPLFKESNSGSDKSALGEVFQDDGIYVEVLEIDEKSPKVFTLLIGRKKMNRPPSLRVSSSSQEVFVEEDVTFIADANDRDGDLLVYDWQFSSGGDNNQSSQVTHDWSEADSNAWVEVTVDDGNGGTAKKRITLTIKEKTVTETGGQTDDITMPPQSNGDSLTGAQEIPTNEIMNDNFQSLIDLLDLQQDEVQYWFSASKNALTDNQNRIERWVDRNNRPIDLYSPIADKRPLLKNSSLVFDGKDDRLESQTTRVVSVSKQPIWFLVFKENIITSSKQTLIMDHFDWATLHVFIQEGTVCVEFGRTKKIEMKQSIEVNEIYLIRIEINYETQVLKAFLNGVKIDQMRFEMKSKTESQRSFAVGNAI